MRVLDVPRAVRGVDLQDIEVAGRVLGAGEVVGPFVGDLLDRAGELDLHPAEHGWGANESEAFFKKHLQL